MMAPAIMTSSVRADSEENMAAYEWLHDIEATTKATFDQFAFESTVTREQAAKFLSVAATELGLDSDSDQECDYNDLDSADASLTDYIMDACNMGLFLAQSNFNPKAPFLRGQAELVIARMLYGMDAVNDYAMDNDMTEFAAAKEMLMDAGVVNVDVNAQSQVKRGHLALMLYRLVDMDITPPCTVGVDCPVVPPLTGDTGAVVEVKNGNLELSLGSQSPANNSSIPYNGVATFAEINFAAGNADINVHSVSLLRQGLGDTADFNRVYFEKNGVRISSRATVATDGTVTISFSPSMIVKAGSTMALDLVASMDGTTAGSEHRFMVSAVNSSAVSSTFNVTTPTLRTANYTVGSVLVEVA